MNFTYIDLFSGAGGLSEGFISAGFKPIAHVEIDKNACDTLRTRLIFHKLKSENKLKFYYDYLLGKINKDSFTKNSNDKYISDSVLNISIGGKNNKIIFNKIDTLSKGREIDIIIGGPPCQAYSLVGRSRDKNKMKDDPRNFLYKEYAKFLIKFNPKIFVFENVIGLITANKGSYFKNMQSHFKRIGYELDYTIQKSEDFGVLQKRRRIILIGWKKGFDFKYPDFVKIKNEYKIKDILSDLKKLKPGEQQNITKYYSEATSYLEKFKIRNGIDFVTQHIARPHNKRDLAIYRIAIHKWLENGERLRYPDLPIHLKTHNNESSFIDRFKVVDINGFSHTMVAHIAKDGHHYIYPDTKQIRSLSVREAARIQSFPDDFFFEGGRTAAFRQIGNAVPPLMSKEIANSIKELLCNKN
jgi:DNA (cytosine-5)-methyltransferase 1